MSLPAQEEQPPTPQQSSLPSEPNDAQNPSPDATTTPSAAPTSSTASPPPAATLPSLPPEALTLATHIFDLARTGATNDLISYIDRGIPLNIRTSKGDSLLMLAAYHGHADTVRELLTKGADPDLLNDRGQSPVAGAVFKGYDDVVRVLVQGVGVGGSEDGDEDDDGAEVGKRRSKNAADIYAGHPNAVDCAVMFKMEKYYELFGIKNGHDGA